MVTSTQNCEEKPKIDASDQVEEGKTWPQILAIIACSLGGLTHGAIISWTSPFILKLKEDKQNYDISENEAYYLGIVHPITAVLTCLIFFKVCDIIGRKKSLLLLTIPHCLCLLISAFARSIYVFYVARVLAGLGYSFLFSASPMYIGEVATPKVRGIWGNAFIYVIYIGQFLMNLVGSYCDAATTSFIFLPVPILFGITFMFMPESPYFYVMKKDYEAAKKSLRFLTRKQNVETDFFKLKHDVERQMSESGSWKDLILIKSNRKALFAGIFMRISQELAGASLFVQYVQFIFEKAGGNVSPPVASMIFSGLSLVLNFVVIVLIVGRFNRKPLYTISLCLTSIVFFIMCAYFYINEMVTDIDITRLNWLPITSMVLYQIMSSFGVIVLPPLMISELFSASIKGKALMILLIVMCGGLVVASIIFNLLNNFFGTYASFLFFGICTAISTILSFYIIPETRGKTLEEIQMALKEANV